MASYRTPQVDNWHSHILLNILGAVKADMSSVARNLGRREIRQRDCGGGGRLRNRRDLVGGKPPVAIADADEASLGHPGALVETRLMGRVKLGDLRDDDPLTYMTPFLLAAEFPAARMVPYL
jgi:hypothetical protein